MYLRAGIDSVHRMNLDRTSLDHKSLARSAVPGFAIAIAVLVVALLGGLFAFGSRLRQRLARKAEPPPRVWNG